MSTLLTAEEFKKRIYDYEKEEDWKYLGDRPCIIDFYADWCGPCKMISPMLDKIGENLADELYVYKVNVEQEGELAALFGISSIPTLLFVSMKELPRMEIGALPLPEIMKIIEEDFDISIQ